MRTLKFKKPQGFTIIEVTIVLAIAGVIMLIVFTAVPALQRNSRNTQRNSDASHLAGLVSSYAANHAGILPTAIGTTGAAGMMNVSGEQWSFFPAPVTANIVAAATFPATSIVAPNIVEGFTCNTSTDTLTAGSTQDFAIAFKIDTSGGTENSCVNG